MGPLGTDTSQAPHPLIHRSKTPTSKETHVLHLFVTVFCHFCISYVIILHLVMVAMWSN